MIGIILAVYNKLEYTKLCLESLRNNLPPQVKVVVVDNASSDGTDEYLRSLQWIEVITNSSNRGCAPAWNQGIKAVGGEWIVLLNNDIVLTEGWWQGLIDAAGRWNLDIVSPAIREGELNYDLTHYSRDFTDAMSGVIRRGSAHATCFMAKRSVFDTIGTFDENFHIGQFEDTDFFRRACLAGFKLGKVGTSFLHHFGSVTQNTVQKDKSGNSYVAENKAYFIRKWKLPWWKRAFIRNSSKLMNEVCSLSERLRYGHTLIEKWINGKLRYF